MSVQVAVALAVSSLLALVLVFVRATRGYALVLGLLLWPVVGWLAHRDATYARNYESAEIGVLRAPALLRGLGEPRHVTTGLVDPEGRTFSADGAPCATNLWYYASFSIDRYQFCYSRDEILVFKYDWSSW